MNISSIAPSTAVVPAASVTPQPSDNQTSDSAGGSANSYQPPPPPPLPPGQGVRVDQLA